ncbi:MAG: DUF2911 domain-containing protein [Flavobacteriaceae bacterium]|nr:DUF2911 domain-containing protein [Flavobacteriaceae bacterium]
MKKFTVLLFILGYFLSNSLDVKAQEFPKLDASPMDINIARNDNMSPIIRVIYSRPQKKNRKIFGELVPFGNVWRTGANEATELEIYEPLKFGDATIEPGTYTLYTIPNEKEWVVIINCDTNAWGAYNYDKKLDEARISVPSKSAAATIESLSMAFKPNSDGVSLMIGWDDRFIEVPFKKVK